MENKKYYYKVHTFMKPIDKSIEWKYHDEYYELQNGCDVRMFEEIGDKEVSKEAYERIVADDERIVKSRTPKSKYLIELFLPESFKDGWHRPFIK